MKKITFFLTILFSTAIGSAQTTNQELVLKSYDEYKNAILTDKGEIAVNYVDNRTIKYYTDILEKIKTADSLEVDAMGIIDKFTVLSIRHIIPKDKLLSFSGRDLLVYAINNGMTGNSIENIFLGDVTTNGNFAKAVCVVGGKETPFFQHFYKESNTWKIDITNLFAIGRMNLKNFIKKIGISENEYILAALAMGSGKNPGEKIWHPIL